MSVTSKTRFARLVTLAMAATLLSAVPAAANGFGKTAPANGATGVSPSPTISWGTVAGAAWYAYCIDTTNDGVCDGISWTDTGTDTSAPLTGLVPHTTYYWQVFASVPPGSPVYADGGVWWSFTTGAASVANDDFDTPTVIGALPYTTNQNVAEATTAGDDPLIPCAWGGPNRSYRSVWYLYSPATADSLTIDTIGSAYDTQLAVWTGSRGSLSNVACGEDGFGDSGVQSRVQFTPTAGTNYYIEVASYSSNPSSPQLVLNVSGPVQQQMAFYSNHQDDGWVLEQDENSGKGGNFNATNTTARVGDDASNRQYRSILSFDTAELPDTAVVTGVTLRIKKQTISGANPFTTHGYLIVDIKTGAFKDNPALEKYDFQAAGSRGNAGRFIKTPSEGWYRVGLRAPAYPLVSLEGITQLRLRFVTDDDNDGVADYLSFYTGDANPVDRPELIVDYYVP